MILSRGIWWVLGLVVVLAAAGVTLSPFAGGGVDKLLRDLTNLPARAVTSVVPPQRGQLRDLRKRERDALRDLSQRLDAQIVWSSNRSGNHELYLLDLRSLEARKLTDHPHVDFSSRFSPDGRRIVFARSQREWVSFREKDAWDIYVLDVEGGDDQLVAHGGYHPSWTVDGRSVVFQRGSSIVNKHLDTGEETVLFKPSPGFPPGASGDPALDAAAGRLALSVRGYGAALINLRSQGWERLTEDQVCQTVWVPGTGELLWVEPRGNGGTRIMTRSARGKVDVLIDLPGERSHEYFPNMSANGRWLVWGATAKGHEHDRADYEIYAWERGTLWETATRLTYYTGNDQWPDIHLVGSSSNKNNYREPTPQ